MSNFEKLKAEIKDKWLDYYESNRVWIDQFACWVECVQNKDQRPNSQIILTAISLLEPRIVDYLIPLLDIDSEGEQAVKALGLDFKPETELEKRAEERLKNKEANIFPVCPEIDPDTEYLNQFRN